MKNLKRVWVYCFVILSTQISMANTKIIFPLENHDLEKIELDTIVPPVIKGEEYEEEEKEEILFKLVEDMPRFPGCEDKGITNKNELKKCSETEMLKFIYGNIKYPAEAREKGTEGKAILQYTIERDGSVTGVKILREPGDGCGAEAVRVVQSMPKWIPGKQRGRAERVQYTLPVRFKVENKPRVRLPNSAAGKTSNKEGQQYSTQEEQIVEIPEDALIYSGEAPPPVRVPPPPPLPEEEMIFKIVEEMPRFPGCEDMTDRNERKKCSQEKMLKFLYAGMKYPATARKEGVEGTAVVQFAVAKNGDIENVRLLRDPGAGCGAEAVRVVKTMPKWIPGKQRGRTVKVQYNLPMKFKL